MDRRTDRSKNNTLRDKCMEMLATAFTFAKLVVSFAQPGQSEKQTDGQTYLKTDGQTDGQMDFRHMD